jgi:hypothetical protein
MRTLRSATAEGLDDGARLQRLVAMKAKFVCSAD